MITGKVTFGRGVLRIPPGVLIGDPAEGVDSEAPTRALAVDFTASLIGARPRPKPRRLPRSSWLIGDPE